MVVTKVVIKLGRQCDKEPKKEETTEPGERRRENNKYKVYHRDNRHRPCARITSEYP